MTAARTFSRHRHYNTARDKFSLPELQNPRNSRKDPLAGCQRIFFCTLKSYRWVNTYRRTPLHKYAIKIYFISTCSIKNFIHVRQITEAMNFAFCLFASFSTLCHLRQLLFLFISASRTFLIYPDPTAIAHLFEL